MSAADHDTPAASPVKSRRKIRRLLWRALIALLLLPVLLVLIVGLLLYVPSVQQFVRSRVVVFLSGKTGTTVQLDRLHLAFPLDLKLEGLYVADEQGDTLLYADQIRTAVGLRALFQDRLLLKSVELDGVRANLRQGPDSTFNFDFIIKAFAGEGPEPPKAAVDSSGGFELDVSSLSLHRIRFDLDLRPSELSMAVDLGQLEVSLDTFSLDPMRFIVNDLTVRNATVAMRTASGKAEPPDYPRLANPLADIDIRFRTIGLEAVNFRLATADTGDSLWISLLHGELKGRSMDHTRQEVALEEVHLVGSDIGMLTHTAGTTADTTHIIPLWLDQHDGFRYWTQDWDLAIDRLSVINSGIAFHMDTITAPTRLIDPAHLSCRNAGIAARDLHVNDERITVQLDSLGLQAGPRGERIELALGLDATSSGIEVRNGTFQAMGNALTFQLVARQGDISNAYRRPEAVPIEAQVGGDLSMAELLPLLHEMGIDLPREAEATERWRTLINVAGTANRVDHAEVRMDGDQGSRIHLRGSVSDIGTSPDNTFDLTVEDVIMGAGLHQLARAFLPSDIPLPAHLALKGHASGSAGDLQATWDLESDLGNVAGTAKAMGWKGAWPDMLDVDLTADLIDAARLSGDTALGPMSFTLLAEAHGLHGTSREGSLTLTPSQLTYHHRDFSSLRLNADVLGDSVHAHLTSDAEAAALQLNMEGRWPDAGDSLAMAMDLRLIRLHLDELGLMQRSLSADGRVTGRLSFLSPKRGRVDLHAPGLHIFNDQREFRFEHFTLTGLLDTDSTAVELDCDVARLDYHANLSMDSTVSLFRSRMLGAFQEPYTFHPPPGRHIDLEVDLPGTDRIASLILPDLHAMEVRRFDGRYDSDSDSLALHVDIPLLDYGGVEVKGLLLSLEAAGVALEGQLAVTRVTRDSLHIDDLVLDASNAPGALRTSMRLRDGELDRYRIGLDLRRENGMAVLHVSDDLVLDRRSWNAANDNALYFDPDGIRARNFILSSDEQRVELNTMSDGTHLEIAGFDLATITGLVRSADSLALLQGTLDGSMLLPARAQDHMEADLRFSRLEVMDVPFGTMNVRFNEEPGRRYRGTLTLDTDRNHLNAEALADLSGVGPNIDVDGELDLNDLSAFSPFVKNYLFELGGTLNGPLHYARNGDDLAILGQLAITEGRIGLVQTGSVYRIPQDTVFFDQHGLSFHDFALFDAADNRFQLDGHVITDDPTPALDLQLRTDRFQLVNSTSKDNPMFYGDLFSSIDLHIGGTAINPTVQGALGVLDSTDLSVVLPGSRVELIDHEGIVQFTADFDAQDTLAVRSDGEMLRDSLAAQLPGIDLDLRVKLDRNARFAVVIDPTTGDQATFRGEADLVFRYDPEGDIYLQGPFTVVDGGYTVEFYGLGKKRFELVPGGTIIWEGDPLAGRMDIQARYSTKVAPYPLVANARGGLTESERNTLQAPLPFDVLINFRDAVQAPNISFGLDMDRQVRNSYPQVNSVLDQLAKPSNQEELNRQVFGLLVLSTFIENESGTEQGGSSLASTAARNSVNSILTQQLNRLTGQGIKGMDIQLGVNTYDQTQGGESYSRTTVDYKVTQRILNDRVSIEAGGSMGYNENKQDVSAMSNTRAPQYAIAYDVTEDGRLRMRVYHENAYDLYDGELVNNGVAIMLTRDFEKNARERERQRQEIIQRREAEKNKEDGK